jgi:hypothetical protein
MIEFWNGLCLGLIVQEVGHGLYLHNSDYIIAVIITFVVYGFGLTNLAD